MSAFIETHSLSGSHGKLKRNYRRVVAAMLDKRKKKAKNEKNQTFPIEEESNRSNADREIEGTRTYPLTFSSLMSLGMLRREDGDSSRFEESAADPLDDGCKPIG